MEHSVKVTASLVYNVVAYIVRTKTQYGWKELPEMELIQEVAAKVYNVCEKESNIHGYIIQKEHARIGELGAFFLVEENDSIGESNEKILELIQKVYEKPGKWPSGDVKFQFTHTYTEGKGKATYTLNSKQMRANFAKALSATGIANRFSASDPLKDRPMHQAEKAELENLDSLLPTDWQPVLRH